MSTSPGPQSDAQRWHPASAYFHAQVGGRVRKVPLDAGLSCPNRDGTISSAGCSFCNPVGSGTGFAALGMSLLEQWERLAVGVHSKYPRVRLLAYLQAFSNTHAAPDHLRTILAEVAALPGVVGLCLGTRPDCLDVGRAGGAQRLDILAQTGLPFVQLELGLQSADNAVLERANRGHDVAIFAQATRESAARGLSVCVHLVHNLPGAAPDDLLRSVEFLNDLPVAGVKFHNLLICRGTALERQWRRGDIAPASREEYVAEVIRALERLRPDICVQRLFADPAPGELASPAWALDKNAALVHLRREMQRLDVWQGKAVHCPEALPDWALYNKE